MTLPIIVQCFQNVSGMKLGISTMAAAALGNTISDLLGTGSAWYVESLADKLGMCNAVFLVPNWH